MDGTSKRPSALPLSPPGLEYCTFWVNGPEKDGELEYIPGGCYRLLDKDGKSELKIK